MQQTDNGSSPGSAAGTVKVWDLSIRLFHWTLMAGFAAAYVTAEFHHGDIHALIGYALCALLALRLYLGLFGSQYARFKSFIFSPGETLDYVRSMLRRQPMKHYYGHNPAGALMVFAMLALLGLIFATGLGSLALIDFEGPLLVLVHYAGDDTSYAIREIHEFLSNAALALVALHLMGVISGSIQHRENLVRAMVTGKKKQQRETH